MRNIQILLQHGSISKWIKWVVVLLLARRRNAVALASFLALNRLINDSLGEVKHGISGTVVDKAANAVSASILYGATVGDTAVPKDYLSVYFWLTYVSLNSPAQPIIILSLSKYFKLEHYRKHPWIAQLYANKHLVVFPMVFAQILSNYLTPTKYKLNHKYLSSSIKKYILNPIWINYSLGVNSHTLNWLGLARYYLYTQAVLGAVVALTTIKSKLWNQCQQDTVSNLRKYVRNYAWYVFHRSNAYVNFIFAPNLIAIFLISLTSLLLRYFHGPYKKSIFKTYTKAIGFVAAFVTVYANSINFIPDFNYHHEDSHEPSARLISKSFLDGLNVYLVRLIVLSKWRIVKENHPSFKKINASVWNHLETLTMCVGCWQLMNLHSAVKYRHDAVAERVKLNALMKGIAQIMT